MLKKIFTVFFSLSFALLSINLCYAQSNTHNYKKNKTISLNEYLYANRTKKDLKTLKLNKYGDVTYKKKVILTDKGIPLNENTAMTTIELKIFFVAAGIKPREGCNPYDADKNGSLGCYIDNPDE